MSDLRNLPKIDALASLPNLQAFPLQIRVESARTVVQLLREVTLAGGQYDPIQTEHLVIEEAERRSTASLRRVINATGVILHTGAGRARLAPSVVAQVQEVAANHASVELDLESGQRGDRQSHVRGLLCELTGAESALVVNNCAAAVFLTLTALCSGGEVVLSRGEMVEIGGSFRMPDIVRQSGCKLVEVGCTNKTRIADYRQAISDQTSAILRCHPSNFRIVGFSETPALSKISNLATEFDVIVIDDLGSGCLVDTTTYGLPSEPRVQDSLRAGADVVLFSGDKMLGGPQAGIIIGKAQLIDRIKAHPLARAVRIDKLSLAGLEATLRLYSSGEEATIPVLAYLSKDIDLIRTQAEHLAASFPGKSVVETGLSEVGGGSIPGVGIGTWRVGLKVEKADEVAKSLRTGKPPILARIEDGKVWLDPRTLDLNELEEVAKRLGELA